MRLTVVPRNLNEVLPPLSRSPASSSSLPSHSLLYSSSSYIYLITPMCLIFIMFLVIKSVVFFLLTFFQPHESGKFTSYLNLNFNQNHLIKIFQVAPSITHRLEGRPGDYHDQNEARGREGDRSVMALRSR